MSDTLAGVYAVTLHVLVYLVISSTIPYVGLDYMARGTSQDVYSGYRT
jgi:hypothetical protein